MVAETELRHTIRNDPGAIRLLAFLNQAHMGSYAATLADPSLGMDISKTRDYRQKFGFGLNAEQEVVRGVGGFTWLGWSDGRNEAWAFSDVDRTATLGVSVKGETWGRAEDTFGRAGVLNGLSGVDRDFLGAGGLGILAGDGRLSYGGSKSWKPTTTGSSGRRCT